MIVVSDSSPLIALAAVERLDMLHALFSNLTIPEAVHREIGIQGVARAGADAIVAADWIERRAVANTKLADVLKGDLDEGEAEAIALALEMEAGLVLIDEQRARRRAADLGLTYTGVLGVVVRAKQQGLVREVRPLLIALRNEPASG